MSKKEEYNLLQDTFNLCWNIGEKMVKKYFLKEKPKTNTSAKEVEELFLTLPKLIPYKVPKKKDKEGIYIPIGETFNKKKIVIDLKQSPHSYIVGTTGSGKSVMTKVILTTLAINYSPDELEIYLADMKRVELNLFRNIEHTKKFVYTVEDTTELIADLLEETNRRYDLFMQHDVTDIFEYNKLPGVEKLKYQVLYIEEIIMLLEDRKKQAMKLLKQLMAISRASGLYVFLTTQRPSNDVIDNVVKANVNNRICFKCEDSKNSIVALDQPGAENLRGNGHGIIKNGGKTAEFQGYFIKNSQIKALLPLNANKSTSQPVLSSNDKLIKEENKKPHKSNKCANFSGELDFLNKL